MLRRTGHVFREPGTMNQPLLKAAVLFLCFAGCSGEAQLTLEQDSEPTVDATSSTSSELASARPLLNMGLGIVPREAWGAWAPGSCRPGSTELIPAAS